VAVGLRCAVAVCAGGAAAAVKKGVGVGFVALGIWGMGWTNRDAEGGGWRKGKIGRAGR